MKVYVTITSQLYEVANHLYDVYSFYINQCNQALKSYQLKLTAPRLKKDTAQ